MQRHLEQQMSNNDAANFSSDEDNDSDSPNEGQGQGVSQELMDKMFGAYDADGQGGRTREAVLQAIQRGHSSCLICISSIK